MNKQLRQFEKESGLEIYGLGKDRVKWESARNKFAELIVKECGVALSPMLRDMVSRGQAYDLIKQHFGVEE